MANGFLNLLFVLLLAEPLNARPSHKILKTMKEDKGYNLLDDLTADHTHRSKRYVLNKKWPRSVLTWMLHKNNINQADEFIVRNTLHRAFIKWSEVSSLRFIELPVESKIVADINIKFLKGDHNDSLPFDGPQGAPNGSLHLDAEENWSLSNSDGINLFQVAIHEIGHVLGLGHSNDIRSIMYPQVKKFDERLGLAFDDIRGIRRLYPPTKQQVPIKLFDKKPV